MSIDFALEPLELAPILIGATFLHGGAGGVIVETEAYDLTDPASHSFSGPRTRNAVMFGPPGRLYVYRIYGTHWCANFVCGQPGGAVLIRAVQPTAGLELMQERRGLMAERLLCAGPGRLCQAMGVTAAENGADLTTEPFTVISRTERPEIVMGPRIGITKAAERPWRFGLKGSRYLSKPFPISG